MNIDKNLLASLMRAVEMTDPNEIGCDDCYDQLHAFAEQELLGRSAEKAMPLVHDHLQRCGECMEEYQAFLKDLKAIETLS